MHILFGTPTAGGIVKVRYAQTLFQAAIAVKEAGWSAELMTLDSAYIARARNYFANSLLRQPNISHLVMIDSDMYFERHIICRLLSFGKPFVAGAYTKRRMDLGIFAQAARHPELTMPELVALASEYNLVPQLEPGSRQLKVTDGLCRVDRIALGCAVMRREVFEILVESGIAGLQADAVLQGFGMQGPFYDFFGEIKLENGDHLSEDYSFCDRWLSKPGNEIWALVDEPIWHVGDMNYGAPYVNRFRQEKPDL